MDGLHDAYLSAIKQNPAKVPLVEWRGTKKVTRKSREGSKNYKQPDWSISGWVNRPDTMPKASAQTESSAHDATNAGAEGYDA